MSLVSVFLGLILFSQSEESAFTCRVNPYSDRLSRLVSIDPEERLRAAWFIPEFAVKAETLALAAVRPGELNAYLDGVPLWDPQTGWLSVFLPPTLIQEASLSNQAPSLTPHVALSSREHLGAWRAQLKGESPFFLDEYRQGQAEAFINIPLSGNFSVSLDGAAGVWDESPRTNLGLPHRGVTVYSGVASASLIPSEGMVVRARLLRSQEQRDLFLPAWAFNSTSAPSSFTRVDLVIFNYRYRTEELDLDMTLSGYSSFLALGGRKQGDLPLFRRFEEQDTSGSVAALDVQNPFGVGELFYSDGRHPQLLTRNSTANRACISAGVFAGEINEVRARLGYTTFNIIADIARYSESGELTSNLQETPRLAELYTGDRIHLNRFWIEPGVGLTYLEIEKPDTSGIELETVEHAISIGPRIEAHAYLKGISISAGSDMPAVVPGFSPFFDTKDESPLAGSLVLIPKQDPAPERAWRSWIEVQKEWGQNWITGISFYSSLGYRILSGGLNPTDTVTDTIPTAGVFLEGESFGLGLRPWVEYRSDWLGIKAAYRFASGKATTAGPIEDYERLLAGDSLSNQMQRLPLDSRHKLTLEAGVSTPKRIHFLLRDWFLQPSVALTSGFPAEEGEEGKLPWWAWCEMAAGRVISIGGFEAEIRVELSNPFGWKEPLFGELPVPSLPTEEDFPERVVLGDEDYHPSRDANHDGIITATEEVAAYQRARAFYDAYTPSPLPARSIELKVSVKF